MSDTMKALSLWQPWATLIACGAKRFETRSWGTKYRGPLVIHAAAQRLDESARVLVGQHWRELVETLFAERPAWYRAAEGRQVLTSSWCDELIKALPFGAAIAVVDLVDCIEVPEPCDPPPDNRQELEAWHPFGAAIVKLGREGHDLERELHEFGNFTPGRFAWLFDDVKPLTPPITMRGRQRLFEIPYRLHSGRFELVAGEMPPPGFGDHRVAYHEGRKRGGRP